MSSCMLFPSPQHRLPHPHHPQTHSAIHKKQKRQSIYKFIPQKKFPLTSAKFIHNITSLNTIISWQLLLHFDKHFSPQFLSHFVFTWKDTQNSPYFGCKHFPFSHFKYSNHTSSFYMSSIVKFFKPHQLPSAPIHTTLKHHQNLIIQLKYLSFFSIQRLHTSSH